MWTFTTYIIYVYIQREKQKELPLEISLWGLYDFECKELKRKHKLFLHSNIQELEDDIKLLSRIGILNYNFRSQNIFIDKEKLELIERIGNDMKNDPIRKKVPLLDEYLKRIENAARP